MNLSYPKSRCSWIALALLVVACSNSGGGSPSAPSPPGNTPSASFRLSGTSYDESVSYVNGTNLVFCQNNGSTPAIWVRMAADPAANGENSRHIDLDICGIAGGGTFSPKEPAGGVCAVDKTWEIWFHDGPNVTFVNSAMSQPCQPLITDSAGVYSGSFSCSGLIDRTGGGGMLDVLDGSFECTIR